MAKKKSSRKKKKINLPKIVVTEGQVGFPSSYVKFKVKRRRK